METSVLGIATCFNRREKTLTSLSRLMEGNPSIRFDFIITDDGSTDGTAQALENMENVTVLTGSGSLYYSGGMRLAIDCAKKQAIRKSDFLENYTQLEHSYQCTNQSNYCQNKADFHAY